MLPRSQIGSTEEAIRGSLEHLPANEIFLISMA
jgi:hypothetical protein